MNLLLKKWWILMLMGAFSIILAFVFFQHPEATVVALAIWVAVLILVSGLLGIIGHLSIQKSQRETGFFIWSLLTALLGAILLVMPGLAVSMITIALGIWVALTGAWLFNVGLALKPRNFSVWLLIASGLATCLLGICLIFDILAGILAVSILLGIQALFAGIGFIVLGIVKKRLSDLRR